MYIYAAIRSQPQKKNQIYFVQFCQYDDIWFIFTSRACRFFQVLNELTFPGVWLEFCNIIIHRFPSHPTLIKEHCFSR